MDSWAREIVERTNRRLQVFFEQKRREAAAMSPEATELVDAVADLTMRGGKRLRAVVMGAAMRSVDASRSIAKLDDEAAAIEVLQSYLLIHDDWMDGDRERRGGPATYAALAKRHNHEHLGACLGILAGDLGATYAWELHLGAPYSATARAEADQQFLRLQKEVYFGQQLDLIGHADVALMHQLKTGSYTVTGPLVLGALMADATTQQLEALRSFGVPVGEAFQLRDDLLGTFGDPSATGKPAGNDLRAGKHNALVARAKAKIPERDRKALDVVLGKANATDADVAAATELLVSSGIRAEVEAAITAKLDQARAALRLQPDLAPEPLFTIADLLAIRSA